MPSSLTSGRGQSCHSRVSLIYKLIFNEVILVINLNGEMLSLNTVGVALIERNVGSGVIVYLPDDLLATLCLGALSYKIILI